MVFSTWIICREMVASSCAQCCFKGRMDKMKKGERIGYGKGGRKEGNTKMNKQRKCGSENQNTVSRTQIQAPHKEQLNEILILASMGNGCLGKSRDACHVKGKVTC